MSLDPELINRVTWKIPNALVLVGSRSGDERNAMTTSWVTQLSMEPVIIGIGVDNTAITHRLISEGGCFSVNLWDAENTRPFVKFSKPASDADGALNGRPVTARPPARRYSTRRSPGWTAGYARRSTLAPTPCSPVSLPTPASTTTTHAPPHWPTPG